MFGEFDGRGKYLDRDLAGGRTPDQVLWDEKLREDRLRRHRSAAARWTWDDALSRPRLARVLAAAGVCGPGYVVGRGAVRPGEMSR